MDDETIEFPITPKKPYTRPQLHDLSGSAAEGKYSATPVERGSQIGPS
jgi:hypothetical protein